MVQNRGIGRGIGRGKKPISYRYRSRLSVRRGHRGVKFYFNPKKFTKISKKSRILENAGKQYFFPLVITINQNIGHYKS